jgi:hypothetical protein
VDFFFGSAGGQSKEAFQKFSSDYMDDSSEIQIGMLATKVLIERPWMHPELFTMSSILCFSVSSTQASTSDSKSVNSYAMGGDFVFRIPAPQIVGVWNQILPADRSEYLNGDDLQRILQFKEVQKLGKLLTGVQPHVEVAPTKPGQ